MAGTFRYKAIDERGKFVRGSIDAVNQTDLELRLAHLGLELINARAVGTPFFRRKRTKVPRHELINYTFHLEQLVSAGVPLLDGLRDLRESIESPRFRDVITEVITAIEGGKTFSQALEAYPDVFSTVFTSMIRVGEESGLLGEILRDLTEMQRWQDELITQTRKAMIYPAFLGVLSLVAVFFQMVYLVPQLVRFVASTSTELPWHTKALIATSDFFVGYWDWLFFLFVVLFFVIRFGVKWSADFRYRWDKWKLKVWVIGPILTKIKLARFANYFALMYSAGITVLDAIRLSRRVVDNVALDAALAQVHASISDGAGISESFAQTQLFPALVVRMLKVGENSGAMDSALLNVNYFYNRQVKEAIAALAPMLAPMLIVLIGGVMLWILLSVVGPIYTAVINIKGY